MEEKVRKSAGAGVIVIFSCGEAAGGQTVTLARASAAITMDERC